MDEACTVSSFSVSRMIYITKAKLPEVDPDQRVKSFDAKVGGFCGCFTTPSSYTITLDKK